MRPDWDSYFLGIASAVAARADCRRRKVGAVVVSPDNRILGTGYNGSYSGGPSCLAGQCPRGLMSLEEVAPDSSYDSGKGMCHALHAEQNAIIFARQDCVGATIYITDDPCPGCQRMIQGAGIATIVTPSQVVNFGIPVPIG